MPLFFWGCTFGGGEERRLNPKMEAFGLALGGGWVLSLTMGPPPCFHFLFYFPHKSRPPPSPFSRTEVEACPSPVYTGLIALSPHPPDDVAVPAVAVAAVRTPSPHLE